MRKLLRTDDRNAIIHHASYEDEDLYFLELVCLWQVADKSPGEPDGKLLDNLPEMEKEQSRRIVRQKGREFAEFNAELFSCVQEILSQLKPRYEKQSLILKTLSVSN
jgi:hypothetical protein